MLLMIFSIPAGNAQSVMVGGLLGLAFTQGLGQNNFVTHEPHIESSYSWGTVNVGQQASQEGVIIGGIAAEFIGGTLKDTFSAETITDPENQPQGNSVNELPNAIPTSV